MLKIYVVCLKLKFNWVSLFIFLFFLLNLASYIQTFSSPGQTSDFGIWYVSEIRHQFATLCGNVLRYRTPFARVALVTCGLVLDSPPSCLYEETGLGLLGSVYSSLIFPLVLDLGLSVPRTWGVRSSLNSLCCCGWSTSASFFFG